MVGAAGEDRDRPVFGSAPVPADGRAKAHQLSSSRWETDRRQRLSGGKVVSPGRVDGGAGGGLPVESRRQQVAAEVNGLAVLKQWCGWEEGEQDAECWFGHCSHWLGESAAP